MRRFVFPLVALSLMLTQTAAKAGPDAITVGVLNDLSGPYADLGGAGSVAAAEIAVEEFGGSVIGKPIKVLSGDHQNKADVGAQLARRWFDVDNVDMVIDFPNSGVALAVQEIARTKKKIAIYSTASTMNAPKPPGRSSRDSRTAGSAQLLRRGAWY